MKWKYSGRRHEVQEKWIHKNPCYCISTEIRLFIFIWSKKILFFRYFIFKMEQSNSQRHELPEGFFQNKNINIIPTLHTKKNHKWIFQEQNGSRPAMRKLSLLFYHVLLYYSPPFGAVLKRKCEFCLQFVVVLFLLVKIKLD